MNNEDHVLAALADVLEILRQVILAEGRDGLRPSQLRVIAHVPSDRAITVTELADHLGMTKQGTGQFVAQLSQLGFLDKEADPADRRVRLVRRSARGNKALHDLTLLLRGVEDSWAAQVGPRRYATFTTVLNEFRAGANPKCPT